MKEPCEPGAFCLDIFDHHLAVNGHNGPYVALGFVMLLLIIYSYWPRPEPPKPPPAATPLEAVEREIAEGCALVSSTTAGIFVIALFLSVLRPDPTPAVTLFAFYGACNKLLSSCVSTLVVTLPIPYRPTHLSPSPPGRIPPHPDPSHPHPDPSHPDPSHPIPSHHIPPQPTAYFRHHPTPPHLNPIPPLCHHTKPQHVMPRFSPCLSGAAYHAVTPHHTPPHHTTPHLASPRHATVSHATPHASTSRHATPHHATPRCTCTCPPTTPLSHATQWRMPETRTQGRTFGLKVQFAHFGPS